jgi:hypothetical protein
MMAKGEAKIREQARSYKNSSKPPIVGAALAANLPERKTERRIRGQARLYAEPRQVRKGLVGVEGLSPHLAKGTDRRRYRPASHRSAYKESIGSKLETDDLCKPAPG